MDTKLEQMLIETLTTDTPQVILSALDPETLYMASTEAANAHFRKFIGSLTPLLYKHHYFLTLSVASANVFGIIKSIGEAVTLSLSLMRQTLMKRR